MNPLAIRRIPLVKVNAQTGTAYTLTHADHGAVVTFNNSATVTVTVPAGLEKGFYCELIELGAGRVMLSPATGVSIDGIFNAFRLSGLNSWAVLTSYAADTFNLTGDVQTISFATDITGCVFWIDASDGDSVTHASNVISQVNDKSGSGFHVTAAGGAQPTYRQGNRQYKNVIRFDGTSDYLGHTTATLLRSVAGWTIFSVHKTTSAITARTAVSIATGAASTRAAISLAVTTGYRSVGGRRADADAFASAAGTTQTGTDYTQWCAVGDYTNTTATLYVDGVQDAVNTSWLTAGNSDNTGGDIYIGAGVAGAAGWWVGDIAEVIIYNTALSTLNRKRVEGYLRQKWGLA